MKKFDKNNPFKTPEGYFENFTGGLMDKLNEDKASIPKDDGFKIPEGYFVELYQNIKPRLQTKEVKVVQLHSYRKYYIAAAAVAAAVVLFFGLNFKSTPEYTFDELAASEIDIYFENNDFELSMYEIGEVIPVTNLEINDILENRFEEEQMLEYLDENIDNFEGLNLEDYE